jgi:single-strand DNA-binding protein
VAGDTVITVIGNLTADPELRFTPSGAAVASFTIASTPRTFDRNTNEWKDGEALFLRCSIWRQRSYETREGEKRTVIELQVDEIGPSLRYASAKVNRTQRGSAQGGFGSSGSSSSDSGASAADDPWSSAAPASGSGGFSDEPPF